jgi:hypothetical protein
VAAEVEVVEAAAGVESFVVSSGLSDLQPAAKRTAAAAIKPLNIQHCVFFINFPSILLILSYGTMLLLAARRQVKRNGLSDGGSGVPGRDGALRRPCRGACARPPLAQRVAQFAHHAQFVPPAVARAGTSQRDVPTIASIHTRT